MKCCCLPVKSDRSADACQVHVQRRRPIHHRANRSAAQIHLVGTAIGGDAAGSEIDCATRQIVNAYTRRSERVEPKITHVGNDTTDLIHHAGNRRCTRQTYPQVLPFISKRPPFILYSARVFEFPVAPTKRYF